MSNYKELALKEVQATKPWTPNEASTAPVYEPKDHLGRCETYSLVTVDKVEARFGESIRCRIFNTKTLGEPLVG